MEHLAWYELLLLFFAASFLGWVLETAVADIKQKKFVNRGLVTGPGFLRLFSCLIQIIPASVFFLYPTFCMSFCRKNSYQKQHYE